MARADSDEEDTFVSIGTALSAYEDDEVLKKPFNIQEQKVTDSKGRQRFHGAFTGGFSAGYYNTVGSKDGWTPSTFVSSRQTRKEQLQQRPEDYMDEDDLGEHGIAPRLVQATDDFSSERGIQRKRPHITDGIIPGSAPLADLIVPASLPVGIRLLRKLGWKDGQGIGPRRRRKAKHKATGGKRIYGCALPSADDQQASESSDDTEDINIKDVTFAPKDVNPISFMPKDNLHGLGYSGITIAGHSGRADLFVPPGGSSKSRVKKGIGGKAFGVGALEEDDEDIYATTSMSEYDSVLGDLDSNKTHGWTAPKHHGKQAHKDYSDVVLEGFKLLSTQLQPKKVYPPPQLPRGYKPHHTFSAAEELSSQQAAQIPSKFSMSWRKMDASVRREALGEKVEFKSVFDLVNEADKKKLDDVKHSHQVEPAPTTAAADTDNQQIGNHAIGSTATTSLNKDEQTQKQIPDEPTEAQSKAPLMQSQPRFTGSLNFKPFAKDPDKQARYEKYLDCVQHKRTYEADKDHMTEWEVGREREEFARAAQLYRPMSSMMASRFTRAQYEDNDNVVMAKDEGGAVSEETRAAEMKMYGKLTRERLQWHPDKLLCKRFNVPNPYPDSTIVGLPRVKREKFSVFNFLGFPGESEPEPPPQAPEAETEQTESSSKKQLGKQGKPLAILASMDLSRTKPKTTSQDAEPTEDSKMETTEENSQNADSDRPPLDVFKAIFGDSDEEQSSQSEDENESHTPESAPKPITYMEQEPAEKSPPTPAPDNLFSRIFGGESASDVANSTDTSRKDDPFSRLFAKNEDTGSKGSSREDPDPVKPSDGRPAADSLEGRLSLSVMDEHRKRLENLGVYGPALPPPSAEKKAENISNDPLKKKKKKKTKDHYKAKHKKKSKHKKHKSKHKKEKKKKKETIVVSSGSSSITDSESSSNSDDTPVDSQILQRMRSLSKRMTAADYM